MSRPIDGPAPREKRVHLAGMIRDDGAVSAQCFRPPRAIDLRRATWTIRPDAVTCPECRAIIRARGSRVSGGET